MLGPPESGRLGRARQVVSRCYDIQARTMQCFWWHKDQKTFLRGSAYGNPCCKAEGLSSSSVLNLTPASTAPVPGCTIVYLGRVYVPCAQSALLHISSGSDRFAALTEAASVASAPSKVILIGNLNASIAAQPDVDDDLGSSLEALHLQIVCVCPEKSMGSMAGIFFSFAFRPALSLGLAD